MKVEIRNSPKSDKIPFEIVLRVESDRDATALYHLVNYVPNGDLLAGIGWPNAYKEIEKECRSHGFHVDETGSPIPGKISCDQWYRCKA